MRLKFLSIIIISLLIQACGEDCNECFTPPEPFYFELIGEQGAENLISSGSVDENQIKIIDQSNNTRVNFNVIDNELIEILSVGWETEIVDLSFQFNDEEFLQLKVNAERVTEDCCTFTRYSEIDLSRAVFEFDGDRGIYKVFLPIDE